MKILSTTSNFSSNNQGVKIFFLSRIFQVLVLFLVVLFIVSCSSISKQISVNIEGNNHFSLSPNYLKSFLLADIIQPQGLTNNNVLLNKPFYTQVLEQYTSISRKYPEDYYSAMRASEIALLLQNKTLALENVKRYIKASHKDHRIQSLWYGLLIGLNFLDTNSVLESYPTLKENNFKETQNKIIQWFNYNKNPLQAKFDFYNQLINQSSDVFWVDIMAAIFLKNDVDLFLDQLLKLSAQFPESYELNHSLSYYHLNKKDFDRALVYFTKNINIPKKYHLREIESRSYLASYYFERANLTKSKVHLEWLMKHSDSQKNWTSLYLSIIYTEEGQLNSALKLLESITHTSQFYIQANYLRAEIYSSQQQKQQALTLVEKIEKNSHFQKAEVRLRTNVILLHSSLLVNLNKVEEATELLNNHLKLEKTNSLIETQLSYLLINQKKYLKASKILEKIIKKEPENAEALNSLGYLLVDVFNKYDEALPLLEKANKLTPNKPHIMDSLGWAYFYLKQYDNANLILSDALSRLHDPEIAYHLAKVLIKKGNFIKANEIIKKGILEFANHNQVIKLKQLQKKLNNILKE